MSALDAVLERARAHVATAEANRRAMPQCTGWIDDLREHLGDGIHVRHVEENGIARGRPGPIGVQAVSFAMPVDIPRGKVAPITRYVERELAL